MGIDSDVIHEEDHKFIEDFECVICRMLADEPSQCQKCKKYFCSECINEWRSKNTKCPLKCSEEDMKVAELSPEDSNVYLAIRTLCDRGCNRYYALSEYIEHVTLCQLPDCSEECNHKVKYSYEGISTCSYNCLIRRYPEMLNDPYLNTEQIKKVFPDLDLSKQFPLIWDTEKSSKEIQIVNMNTFMSISTDDNFHTIVSKVGLMGGVHRFQIEVAKSAFPLKIGVTKNPNTPSYRHAFCDFEPGFGIYTIGQTRNDSNASGLIYGEKLDNNSTHTIKMELSMGEGKLKFKFNGKHFGHAFEENDLKEGTFYVAFAIRQAIGETKVTPITIF